nr:hypothetical protein [uncultured Brevundimonas sp.]
MRGGAGAVAAVTGVLALSACSAMLNLSITGGLDRPEVTFDEGRRACVRNLSVYERSDRAYAALWSIEAAGRKCVMLRRVVYGQAPDGFTVRTPAVPLRADGVYEVMGAGVTTHPLSKAPWTGGARFHFREGQWRIDETRAAAVSTPQ